MKQFILAILGFGLGLAWNAQAGDRVSAFGDGRNVAARHCSTLSFSSRRDECMDVVRQARYLDEGAVEICKTLDFESNLLSCFRAITDRQYLDWDLTRIQEESFDSNKIDLLRRFGRPYSDRDDVISRRELRDAVERAIYQLDRRNIRDARSELQAILDRLGRF
jgi:hypothetical protein